MKNLTSLLLVLSLTLGYIRGNDVKDNELDTGEELWIDPEVEEDQIDNMDVETAVEADSETATYDIEHEDGHENPNHFHVTFRGKYCSNIPVKEGRRTVKKEAI
jgi:hypothetical protein